jgi:hypothetical protein
MWRFVVSTDAGRGRPTAKGLATAYLAEHTLIAYPSR